MFVTNVRFQLTVLCALFGDRSYFFRIPVSVFPRLLTALLAVGVLTAGDVGEPELGVV